MGKRGFSPIQKLIFDAFSGEDIAKKFYFTGGTALSVYYLHHRFSEDLDFFSESDFDNSEIIYFVNKISRKMNLHSRFTQRDKARIFEFVKNGKLLIKLDFVFHPYKRIEKGIKENNLGIDSLRDIATNKLLAINQRMDVKDFVDLYFLLKKYTIWDLLYGVETKFQMEMDMVLIASDFFKVKDFTVMPKMIRPLSLPALQTFFRKQAKLIGEKVTK